MRGLRHSAVDKLLEDSVAPTLHPVPALTPAFYLSNPPAWLLIEDGVHERDPGGAPASFRLSWTGLRGNYCLFINIVSFFDIVQIT